jgi:hypothetical protein
MRVRRRLRRYDVSRRAVCLRDASVNIDDGKALGLERNRWISCFFPSEQTAA